MRLLDTFPNYETMPENCVEFIHRAMTEFALADNPPFMTVPCDSSPVLAVWDGWKLAGFVMTIWNDSKVWMYTRDSTLYCLATGWSKGVRAMLNNALKRTDPGRADEHDKRMYGYPEPPGP